MRVRPDADASTAAARWPLPPDLVDRDAERKQLDELVAAIRDGTSRALVLHGGAGIGKTALLEYLAGRAEGCQVTRTAGVQTEMELAFAGLHQLCTPMLDRLPALPAPQRDALRTAFGLHDGPPADRFLIGLAVLNLLSEAAQSQPLLCLIDDQQWLDYASSVTLGFVARRLGAESVGLVFAARTPGDHLAGVEHLAVPPLSPPAARQLLNAVVPGPIDGRIRDRIVAESQGNPLALVELPAGLRPVDLAVGVELPGAVSLAGSAEESFERRIGDLPHPTRLLLLLASVEPTGDTILLWRAAGRLGIDKSAAVPAVEAGLVDFGAWVRFRHPLVRDAVYRAASAIERREAHAALAEVTDPGGDAERRSWHQAQAALGPDESVAAELDRSADRAANRGCVAAAAAYSQRAAILSEDPDRRAVRIIRAAEGKVRAGAFDVATELLATADTDRLDDREQARADLVRAQLASVTDRGREAPLLLLRAAARLKPIDPALSRVTYLDALSAAIFAGRLAPAGGGVLDVAGAAAGAPRPTGEPQPADLLLDGFVASYTRGFSAGLPVLRRAVHAAGEEGKTEPHWLWLASIAAMRSWEDEHWDALSARHVQLARETGALSDLPLALTSRTYALLFRGDLAAAGDLAGETEAVSEAIDSRLAPYGALGVAALRGDESRARRLVEETVAEVTDRGEGVGITLAEWAGAVLDNGLGRYDSALAAARRATAYEPDLGSLIWPVVELIEAASRAGEPRLATSALRRLSAMTTASGTPWALGLEARSRAVVADGPDVEQLYRRSIEHLRRTRQRIDLARAHLLYGEWLRRDRRRVDGREQLQTAHRLFEEMGANAFAERARAELLATGATARRRNVDEPRVELTAQETQVARLAQEGLSNLEIGTRLFISAHTVKYHLRKVFLKLGISSRNQLARVLVPDAVTSGSELPPRDR